MSKAKGIFYTIVASVAVGAVIGMLFAPNEGAETRRKLRQLKKKLTCADGDGIEDLDKETLEELSASLREQLHKINKRLEEK